jgi:hypothetical protein
MTGLVGNEYVAYLFADTPGKIKCGTYTNATTGNAVVDCGFKPGWVMIKNTLAAGNWYIFDNKRMDHNDIMYPLFADETKEEEKSALLRFNDTGFMTFSPQVGTGTFIYVAIAEDAMAGEFSPTGIITESDVNGPTMTLSNTTGDWNTQTGKSVIGPDKAATGTVVDTDDSEISLSSSDTFLQGTYLNHQRTETATIIGLDEATNSITVIPD